MAAASQIQESVLKYWRQYVPLEYDPVIGLNRALAGLTPCEVLVFGFALFYILSLVVDGLVSFKNADKKKAFFKFVKGLPVVKQLIARELNKSLSQLEDDLTKQLGGIQYNTTLPEKGWSKAKVTKEIERLNELGDFKAEDGALSGVCHKPPEPEKVEVVTEAYRLTAYANPLNPDAFPGIRKMEAEVVRMALNLFHGNADCCGTMTSGGTESIILACKAYRNFAKETRGITKPNLVMSQSGHVGFDKGAHLLGMEVRIVPMDPVTMTPNLRKYRNAIDSNTVMYPHGVMDPIEEIGKMALKYKIPLHVDACLGGFLLAFIKRAGFEEPKWDFAVPGVTSISADTHKFGYAPKGSSLILYSSREYLYHQFYVCSGWSGGVYASPAMGGSRSGGLIAACWAAMVNHGVDGYVDTTRRVVTTLRAIADGIRKIDGLKVIGDPICCIVSFTSDNFHIYTLADEMRDKGWLLQSLQKPTCVHLYVTPMHTQKGIKERFLNDLATVTAKLMKEGKKSLTGRAAVYGMAQSVPDQGLVDEMVLRFIASLYTTGEK